MFILKDKKNNMIKYYMFEYIYNYLFGDRVEQKIDNNDLLILKKSININNMNKLDPESYKIETN